MRDFITIIFHKKLTMILNYVIWSVIVFGSPVHSNDSKQLTDVIKSNGFGNINLLKDFTAIELENIRVEANGYLIFSVDVNEAASGTEKAITQAITIKKIELVVTLNGSQHIFTQFETETQALVAEINSTNKKLYYTLIGDSGSNRITANNVIQNRFDSNITIPVDMELNIASNIQLNIELLQTNVSLGDPEAFYDFSNGYEDLALINLEDKLFLDSLSPGREVAPTVILSNPPAEPDPLSIVSQQYFPNSTTYYLVAYEDKFPLRGDYDFNDLTVAYQTQFQLNVDGDIVGITGSAYLVTRGATYNHDWYLSIALPENLKGNVTYLFTPQRGSNLTPQSGNFSFTGDLQLKAFSETKTIFYDPGFNMVNTLLEQAIIIGPKYEFEVRLDTPVSSAQIAAAPFDPYLYVYNTRYEIHLPGQAASPHSLNNIDGLTNFKDDNGFPFAMLMPETWEPPLEQTELLAAYPDFAEFVISSGNQKKNWYDNALQNKVKKLSDINWRW